MSCSSRCSRIALLRVDFCADAEIRRFTVAAFNKRSALFASLLLAFAMGGYFQKRANMSVQYDTVAPFGKPALVESDAVEQVGEAGVAAEGIEVGMNFQKLQDVGLFLVGLFDP